MRKQNVDTTRPQAVSLKIACPHCEQSGLIDGPKQIRFIPEDERIWRWIKSFKKIYNSFIFASMLGFLFFLIATACFHITSKNGNHYFDLVPWIKEYGLVMFLLTGVMSFSSVVVGFLFDVIVIESIRRRILARYGVQSDEPWDVIDINDEVYDFWRPMLSISI